MESLDCSQKKCAAKGKVNDDINKEMSKTKQRKAKQKANSLFQRQKGTP